MAVPLTNTTQNSLPSLTHQLVNNGYMDPIWYRFFYAFLGQLLSTNVLINANNLSDVSNSLTSFNNISPLKVAGDMLYFDGTNNTRLASDITATRYIANTGTLNEPQWDTVNLANGVNGNLDVSHLNSGTNAGTTTFWCGNGAWVTTGQGLNGTQVFTSNGTFNIPAGVSKMLVKAWGAGGGGGNGFTAGGVVKNGGSGGAGGYLESVISIPNGTTTLSITVGVGSLGTGGNSIISGTGITTLTAFGGTPGGSSTGVGLGSAGVGGSTSGSTLSIPGNSGVGGMQISAPPATTGDIAPMSIGGSSFGSSNGYQYIGDPTNIPVGFPGGGGAGGGSLLGTAAWGGTSGANGMVQLTW